MSKYVLMKDHCPCCYKHFKSCEYVKRDSEKLDKTQLYCSSKNPMKLYNLGQPGKPCSKTDEDCQITCLVCGKSVISWEEWNFQKVRRYVIGDTERPVRKIDIKEDILQKNAAVFVHWKTPVHINCTYVADCGCRLVKGIHCEFHEKKKDAKVLICKQRLLPEYEKMLQSVENVECSEDTQPVEEIKKVSNSGKCPFETWNPTFKVQEKEKKPFATLGSAALGVKTKKVIVSKTRPTWMKPIKEGEFDTYAHGYFQCSNGTLMYKHQDGRIFKNCTGCDCFD